MSGRQVLLPVGALSIGPDGHPDLASTMRSIDSYGLPHRALDAAELRDHYPQFAVRHDDVGILDELGGGLRPEVAVMSATACAVARGAEVRHHTQVLGVDEGRDGVTVTTSTGTIRARRVVVTVGSWTTRLLPELADLVPDPVRWSIHHDSVTADHMPIIDTVGNGRIVVATGMSGNGFKFAPAYGQVLAELVTDAEAALRHPMFTIAGHHRRTAEAA